MKVLEAVIIANHVCQSCGKIVTVELPFEVNKTTVVWSECECGVGVELRASSIVVKDSVAE